MSRKGTNLSSVRVLMARPVAIRDGPRASGNHYSLVNPRKKRFTKRVEGTFINKYLRDS